MGPAINITGQLDCLRSFDLSKREGQAVTPSMDAVADYSPLCSGRAWVPGWAVDVGGRGCALVAEPSLGIPSEKDPWQ